ncbi:MAG: UDP-N-acetylmuramoyl-L-alanyl-D-glutamate--2,6-diaminopimelate ligase [Pseudomonadales bacterium]
MTALAQVLEGMTDRIPAAARTLDVSGMTDDSRQVRPGDLFVAVSGGAADGHAYLADAVAAGAVAVLAERNETAVNVPVIVLEDLKRRRGTLAARVYGEPSAQMTCVGVTGTNGKTSIACFVAELAGCEGEAAGYMGTIGWGRLGALEASGLTTESAITVQRRLAGFREQGIDWAVLEVSSHALDQHRVDAVAFDYAVFSNLTRDHLDYHQDFDSYGRAKARLFRFPGLEAAIVNIDDPFGRTLAADLEGQVRVVSYGASADADIRWSDLEFRASGVTGRIATPWGEGRFELPLYGDFSVANAAAALGVLCATGRSFPRVLAALAGLSAVPGRMEFFPGRPTLVVDYAHTPDAVTKMLTALRPHCAGRLVCLIGCGGDRDRGKRPLMAQAACHHADVVWLTSDNPRSEAPERIIDDMLAGVPEGAAVHVEAERLVAIRRAAAAAGPEDLVVIAGKGHEDYQEIRGRRLPFSDRAIAAELTGKPLRPEGGI